MQVGLGPGDNVLVGDPAPLPQFSPHVYCGQTTGWIKMPLGMEAGLGPGYIVLDGDLALPPKKKKRKEAQPPSFGSCVLLRPNGWMDQDVSWYEGRPRSRPRCATWGPSSPLYQRGTAPSNFWPMSIVAKRSPISATAEHLFVALSQRNPPNCHIGIPRISS